MSFTSILHASISWMLMCFFPLSSIRYRFQLLDYVFEQNRFHLNDVCFILQLGFVVSCFFAVSAVVVVNAALGIIVGVFVFSFSSHNDALPLYRGRKNEVNKTVSFLSSHCVRVRQFSGLIVSPYLFIFIINTVFFFHFIPFFAAHTSSVCLRVCEFVYAILFFHPILSMQTIS